MRGRNGWIWITAHWGLGGIIVGPPGPKGDTRVPGPKGERVGGVVYVWWGHNSCPDSGAQLVYAGRAGGSHYTHKGGGGNPQCLPLNPNYFNRVGGSRYWSYGAEYESMNLLVANTHDTAK